MPTEIPSRPDTRVLDGKLWHTLPLETALAQLGLSHGGLTTAEANSRRETFGPNELEEKGGRTVWHILWEQVSSVMIVILLIAGVLALLFKGGGGPPIDAIAIFSIVILFVVQGVMQEYRAQKAIAALKQMSSPTVKVVRDGQVQEMSARDLVPGDLVKLETGSVVPADCRIVERLPLRANRNRSRSFRVSSRARIFRSATGKIWATWAPLPAMGGARRWWWKPECAPSWARSPR